MCQIIWCHTNAEGMATLWAAAITAVPAILAVIAAGIVGKRQLIIMAAAHSLEDQRLRAELYDRRSAIYSAARAFVHSVQFPRVIPGISGPEGSLFRDFTEAVAASEFLFDDKVAGIMNRIFDTALVLTTEDDGPKKTAARFDLSVQIIELKNAVRPYIDLGNKRPT